MKHIVQKLGIPGIVLALCALPAALAAQAFSTTTVQGTVYLANGAPGSGTLQLSWPAFTTAASQAVAAGRMMATIGADGFLSVNLSPNAGATPAGLYYTAVYHLSDGTTSTEYWVVPAAAQASIAQVRATVMPAAQAVQAVSKTYVDQAVQLAAQSQLTASGGNLTGPLYLNGDPGSPTQAATKHYVDNQFSQALSVNGGTANGPLTATQLGAIYQADQFTGSDFGAKLQACLNALNTTYGGTCDARNFTGTLGMAANLTISKANVTVNLPCATISTASQIVVTAGTRNVALHGCASRGTTAASGNQGGTVLLYSGTAAAIQAGDATYSSDTLGFHLDNVVINTTSSTAPTARAIAIWRTQELHLEALYLLGNANQTGITLDGTGNYTGGTLTDVEIGGFQTAINGIGHQVANPAPTDWVNASTFVRLHIDCPTSNGNPIAGTSGINLLQGDGNMLSGGDVEGCATALHLGPNAQNNTIVGLRNENSTYQVVADSGSAYNNWMTGGTMFTGRLTDNGTRNSFLDTFHRSFNGINGDWYGSQQDATLMNHFRLGIGNGNERGLQNRYQTDYGYRWTTGLTDATAGEQFYQVLDELNNVNRISIGQYNNGQGSTNNQTVINAAGTGAIVLNGSNNAGSGGVMFGSGGPSSTTVATINNAGNAWLNGTLQVSGTTTFTGSPSAKNQADAEIDYFLQAGATAPQKESVIYKDWNGASQWYLVKDASNNWALNSAVGGVDSFKAYQSTNSGDTYIDAANNAGVVRVNYEPGSGSAFNVYGGGSSNLYASFNGTTGIKFPGLASSSGKNCVQIDNSGYLSNTGTACAANAVGAGTTGQIAYYPGNGSAVAGMAAVPVTAGGTGATSAGAALTSLGGLALSGGTLSGPLTLSGDPSANLQAATKQYVDPAFNGSANDQTARNAASAAQAAANASQDPNCKADGNGKLNCGIVSATMRSVAPTFVGSAAPLLDIRHSSFAGGAVCDGSTDIGPALQAAVNSMGTAGGEIQIVGNPASCYWANPITFHWPSHSAPITLKIQGSLKAGTTVKLPGAVNLVGLSAGGQAQFQTGQTGQISGPPTTGTIGTTIPAGVQTFTPSTMTGLYAPPSGGPCPLTSLSRNSAGMVTASFASCSAINGADAVTIAGATDPSFNGSFISFGTGATSATWMQPGSAASTTGGTITGLFAGSAITVAGMTTCTPTSLARASGIVTASFPSSCHIPGGVNVTVAGMSDSSFNGTFYLSGNQYLPGSDYVLNTLTYSQPGADGTTSGGTVTGVNEDSVETAQIVSTTGTTATGTFVHSHNPTDQWGIVGLEFKGSSGNQLRDVSVGGSGTAIVMWGGSTLIDLDHVATVPNPSLTGYPMEINESFWIYDRRGSYLRWGGFQPWAIRMTNQVSNGTAQTGAFWTDSSVIEGVKIDSSANTVTFHNTVFEQPGRSAVQIDPTGFVASTPNLMVMDDSGVQDAVTCLVGALYPVGPAPAFGSITLHNGNTSTVSCVTGNYYRGTVITQGNGAANFGAGTPRGVVGQYEDGKTFEANVRSVGAGLGPSVVPYASQNVTTNPASWSGCNVTPVMAPDGTMTAGQLSPASGSNCSVITFFNSTYTATSGDWVIASVWVNNATSGANATAAGSSLIIDNGGSSNYQFTDPLYGSNSAGGTSVNCSSHDSLIVNDWWHPITCAWQVTGATGSPAWLREALAGSNSSAMQYWMPSLIVVPNSAGIPLKEVMRWQQQLLHGAVPANASAGDLGMAPGSRFNWGGDTNLYRAGAGALRTDGAFDAAGGFKQNGAALNTTINNTNCPVGGSCTVATANTTTPDSATCSNVTLSTTSTDVCNMTIPANRIPNGGLYVVSVQCTGQLTQSSGGTSSTYSPLLYFYDGANSTKYGLSFGNVATGSSPYGFSQIMSFTNWGLLAPASGNGFTQVGGLATSEQNNTGTTSIISGPQSTPHTVEHLVSGSGSNQIQVWISTSATNTPANAATCTITGYLQH